MTTHRPIKPPRGPTFGLVQTYVLRTVGLAFLACLTLLTLVVWINQALRELNLVTATNQTFLVFLSVTALSLPILLAVIAPAALFIAAVFALNKHNGDSELVVISAAGMSPNHVLRPLLLLAILVSLFVAAMTLWAIPSASRTLRDMLTRIRADIVSTFLREGQFLTLDKRVTFHFRERAGDALVGIFIHDRRNDREAVAYTAERGRTLQSEGKGFLVLEKGTVQRLDSGERGSGLVTFERYAIDLSQLSDDSGVIAYRPRERTTAELLSPKTDDPLYARQATRFSAELHDRFTAPLYPIVFTLIAFAALGPARTTRQGRGLAIGAAIVAMFSVRLVGFAVTTRIARSPSLAPLAYVVPALASLAAALFIWKGQELANRLLSLQYAGDGNKLAEAAS